MLSARSILRPLAWLTLLAGLAPHHTDGRVVAEFRALRQQDADVVAAVAFSGARRIGSWLA
jgi:hypothetical protein